MQLLQTLKRDPVSFYPTFQNYPADNILSIVLVGIAMGMTMLGSVIGPVIGGALTTSVSWRWCEYYVTSPLIFLLKCFL